MTSLLSFTKTLSGRNIPFYGWECSSGEVFNGQPAVAESQEKTENPVILSDSAVITCASVSCVQLPQSLITLTSPCWECSRIVMLSSFALSRRCTLLTSQHSTALACDSPTSEDSLPVAFTKKKNLAGHRAGRLSWWSLWFLIWGCEFEPHIGSRDCLKNKNPQQKQLATNLGVIFDFSVQITCQQSPHHSWICLFDSPFHVFKFIQVTQEHGVQNPGVKGERCPWLFVYKFFPSHSSCPFAKSLCHSPLQEGSVSWALKLG